MSDASGVPFLAEIDVDDPDAAAAFYAAVLGWAVTSEGFATHHRALARHDGRPVAAIGSPGVAAPPAWTLYLAVDDVDDAAEQVAELGGHVLHGPEDDLAGGRLALALDAGGAVVGLWESDEAAPPPAPGRLCWAEAASAEPGTTRTFYRGLLGWDYVEGDEPGHALCLGAGGRALAGIGFAGDALPHWLAFFGVADAAAAVSAVQEAGGSVLTPLRDATRGRHAVLADPAGARFGVLESVRDEPAVSPGA